MYLMNDPFLESTFRNSYFLKQFLMVISVTNFHAFFKQPIAFRMPISSTISVAHLPSSSMNESIRDMTCCCSILRYFDLNALINTSNKRLQT